ncbi:MAG TPA: isoleucine--tRNA ligase [Terriglobales bacterium]|nr:isoleucine--tRNA ligase [Terriglobales bacterium]
MPVDLKATINLPKTAFPMKANLPQNEPKLLARWEEQRIYDQIRRERKGSPVYLLHDGPPYANGPIHLGHALNKCLKDFIVKSKSMAGFDAPYVPGWDCHGLPIEIKVDESLGGKKLQMDPMQVRQVCREYAAKYLDLQRSQFKRLGIFGEFERPYSTMTPEYESVVVETLFKFFEKDAVYKGLRPVYWCIHDRTALAEAEVEYENHTSPSVWVRYAMQSDPRDIDTRLGEARIHSDKKIYAIIWTTTPWTLPASMAIAFHPDEEYVALETADSIYIVAAKLAAVTAEKCGFGEANAIARFPGRKLEHTWFYHPFLPWPERKILGVLADYVTMDQGTGAVHTAPAHGADDFYTGVKYKIDQTCNVDAAGRLLNGLPEYNGLAVFDANSKIVDLLKSRGVLLHFEKIEHSYPHCWRCHNPVIFRATEQWFISMEAKIDAGESLRKRALEEISKVNWDPAWGEERIANMIATRPDWCISRQRVWGVPIAVFTCAKCKTILNRREVHKAVVDLFASKGADAWYTTASEQIVPAGTKCQCGGDRFHKEMDIIDVWFESGSSYLATQRHQPGWPYPSDLYLEGGDQYRGWFHSSLLCSVGATNQSPYRGVATNGWTLDPQGRAMSKSLGNGVDPVEITDKLGAEIVRLWSASVDFREDVRCSNELMERVAENYRKVRNTFRYILGNLNGFDPTKHVVPFEQMHAIDQYILLRTAEVSKELRGWYEEFQFHKVYQQLIAFSVVDLSAVYFDVLKDRLYTSAPNSPGRRSAQTAIWRIGEALVRLVAPLMSFTADEVWQYLPPVPGRSASVHVEKFWSESELAPESGHQHKLKQEWEALLKVRVEVLKALEAARERKEIGSGLEAQITLHAPESLYPVLEKYKSELRYIFIVSNVELLRSAGTNGSDGLKITVSRASGQKCERCWNYSTHVGENLAYPMVCERCSAVLEQIESGTV